MARQTQVRQLAVLAYGSLLAHPGEWLGRHMEKVIRCRTPFGVEYAGRSNGRRGGAPTLVRWQEGKSVAGALIVLRFSDTPENLEETRVELAKREGLTKPAQKIKDDLEMYGFRVVYSDFLAKIKDPDPKKLADAAIKSVEECVRKHTPFMNGIRYLLENMEWGIITELTKDYKQAILTATATSSLQEAEYGLLKAAMNSEGGAGSSLPSSRS